MKSLSILVVSVLLWSGLMVTQSFAQHVPIIHSNQRTNTQTQAVTLGDYQRAATFLPRNMHNKVLGNVDVQDWTSNGQLLYSTRTANGLRYILANPRTGNKAAAFNRKKLAKSVAELTGKEIKAVHLQLWSVELAQHGSVLKYRTRSGGYITDLQSYTTKKQSAETGRYEIVSPDGKKVAYIKNYNLWVRNLETGEETQLTFDGRKYYGYATNNGGWIKTPMPVLRWGPNSEQIATFRQDARNVGFMYLYDTQVGHSDLKKWKYALPGDTAYFQIERVIVQLPEKSDSAQVVTLQMDADAQRSTISDHIASYSGEFLDTEWFAGGKKLAFVSVSRNHHANTLRVADAQTGEVRDVLTEKTDNFYESGSDKINWEILEETNEVIWYSSRDGWAHLYLYNLKTGELKHQITEGDWRVLDITYIDEANRVIYFTGSNRESGNPYFHYLYKVNFDGTGLTLLTPEKANHDISWSPSHRYFVDTYSTPTEPSVSVIRNTNGKVMMKLEEADISRLKEMGWQPPIPFTVKARDGETTLYGLMYKPTNFDPSKSYPVVNYLYPGPQAGSIGSWSFSPARGDHQALAELGFVVVTVNALGTPGRSKQFQAYWYGNMHDNGIPDQVATIKQLAQRHTWMDTSRVGIWGHSGGGYAAATAILMYPDFYSVAIAESGNHDNRNYESAWGDKWQGLLHRVDDSKMDLSKPYVLGDNYDSQANENYVDNLEGDLLLIHGLMDTNVPPTNTLLMVDALIKAQKDFDMFLIPNANHGYGYAHYYIVNKRWDYFVKNLMGAKPVKSFDLQ